MEEVVKGQSTVEKKEKLWTANFLLLWQGQFVSGIGDMAYEIALGFWVLAVTGSTGIMGTLMAATMLPRVIAAPFAGVVVDRADRKRLMIVADTIRGIFIVLVGVAALTGVLKVWMVFAAGMIMGLCGAFFGPSVSSALPDIVSKSQIMKANSVFSMIYSGTSVLGNAAGGFFYQILGAPLMFLFNGISYLLSAFSITFMKIPRIESTGKKVDFLEEMKEGFKFVWEFKALRYLVFIAAFVNFFANMAMVLFLPFFQRTSWLGAAKYGIAAATIGIGMLCGMIFTSVYNIKPHKRMGICIVSTVVMSISWASFVLFRNFPIMLALIFLGGFTNAIINVFFQSTMQLTVPQNMRGKVFSLLNTLLMGLSPFAMALGGVIAVFIPIKGIIFVCFMITLILFLPFTFMKSFKRFINFDPDNQVLEDII